MKPKNRESEPEGPRTCRPENLDLAYRIHTLAQLVFRQVGAPISWSAPAPAWPPMPSVDLAMGPVPAGWPCCP